MSQRLQGRKVLVVDDDADTRELVRAVLSEAGAEVQVASSAAMGFDAIPRFRPHVVISDIGMPGEDGYSLIDRIRALPGEAGGAVPVVALTAYTRHQDRTRALAAGFSAHVGKPVEPQDLLRTIANLAPPTPSEPR